MFNRNAHFTMAISEWSCGSGNFLKYSKSTLDMTLHDQYSSIQLRPPHSNSRSAREDSRHSPSVDWLLPAPPYLTSKIEAGPLQHQSANMLRSDGRVGPPAFASNNSHPALGLTRTGLNVHCRRWPAVLNVVVSCCLPLFWERELLSAAQA